MCAVGNVKLSRCGSMQEKGFSSHNSYSLSKLAAMMFTYELADIMKPSGVTVNCLDPGTVNTKMLIAGMLLLLLAKPCRWHATYILLICSVLAHLAYVSTVFCNSNVAGTQHMLVCFKPCCCCSICEGKVLHASAHNRSCSVLPVATRVYIGDAHPSACREVLSVSREMQ